MGIWEKEVNKVIAGDPLMVEAQLEVFIRRDPWRPGKVLSPGSYKEPVDDQGRKTTVCVLGDGTARIIEQTPREEGSPLRWVFPYEARAYRVCPEQPIVAFTTITRPMQTESGEEGIYIEKVLYCGHAALEGDPPVCSRRNIMENDSVH